MLELRRVAALFIEGGEGERERGREGERERGMRGQDGGACEGASNPSYAFCRRVSQPLRLAPSPLLRSIRATRCSRDGQGFMLWGFFSMVWGLRCAACLACLNPKP
jgi:hypothetical protein